MDDLEVGKPARGTTTGRPILVVLDALGRRSALRLLWELRDGQPRTFRALITACDSNPGSLNSRLRELRALHVIELGSAGYQLTGHGADLLTVLTPLNTWAKDWAASTGNDVA